LASRGLTVLRFDDRQVLTETQAVLEMIFQVVNRATGAEIPPSPPLQKGGANPPHVTEASPLGKRGDKGISQVAELAQTMKKA
jgi:hypothetical protein